MKPLALHLPDPARRTGVVTALILTVTGCGRGAPADEATATDMVSTITLTATQIETAGVRWEVADTGTMSATLEIPGQLVPDGDHSVVLGSPVEGRVLRVDVSPGDRVKAGQPLVQLVSPQGSAARADHEKAEAAVASQRAAAAFAQAALSRAERLFDAKAASQQEVERAHADERLAQAALDQAEAELARTQNVLDQYGVDVSTDRVVLRAPIAGVVLTRQAQPGAVVAPGTPLVSVADPRTLWLEASLAVRDMAGLAVGTPVRFGVAAFPADTFRAEVVSVGGALDPTTRTLPIRATVQNEGERLRPEMFATAWIEQGGSRQSVTVPEGAIQRLDQHLVVFVVTPAQDGGARFERRDVDAGGTSGGRTQIRSGLEAGELVVVDGAYSVKSEFARADIAEG